MTELINRIHRADFEQDTNFLVSRGSNLITVKHSLIKGGRYYRTGDEVRIEEVTSKDLLEMARDLSRHMPKRPREVIFFDLDEHHFNKYITNYESETNFFKDVVRCFYRYTHLDGSGLGMLLHGLRPAVELQPGADDEGRGGLSAPLL